MGRSLISSLESGAPPAAFEDAFMLFANTERCENTVKDFFRGVQPGDDDIRALQKLHEFTPGGLADLAEMAKQRGIKAQGLRTLAAQLMGCRISKAAQCSNWAKKTLTPQQIRYAATDAWIGREIYLRMMDQG